MQAILNVRLPDDPVIRLTDYARQYAVINQIKIIMNHVPKELELYSGEVFKVWWIIELSGMICWDLVPGILDEKSLEEGAFNFLNIMRHLTIADEVTAPHENDPIFYFLKFPHHPMLGFEIVRALICRKRNAESLEILKALLRVTPHHLNSRITRMMLYKFFGTEAPNYFLANMMFAMAEKEAAYILENLSHIGEDFYYEYALLKLARFSTAIKALRQHDDSAFEKMNLRLAKPDLFTLLEQADELVMQGIIVSSPTVERIMYLFLLVQMLKCVLAESLGERAGISARLACPNGKIKQHMLGVITSQHQLVLSLGTIDLNLAMRFTKETINYQFDLIALKPFRPSNYFLLAVFYWDILPVRNVRIIRETLKMLEDAIKSAQVHALNKEPVYSLANLSGQFVTADQFISEVDSLIKEIEKRYHPASELEKMDPDAVIGPADDDLVLSTYHV